MLCAVEGNRRELQSIEAATWLDLSMPVHCNGFNKKLSSIAKKEMLQTLNKWKESGKHACWFRGI